MEEALLTGVGLVWVELCWVFAYRQDCVRIGYLSVAAQRFQLHAFFIDAQRVEPENVPSLKTDVGPRPFVGWT